MPKYGIIFYHENDKQKETKIQKGKKMKNVLMPRLYIFVILLCSVIAIPTVSMIIYLEQGRISNEKPPCNEEIYNPSQDGNSARIWRYNTTTGQSRSGEWMNVSRAKSIIESFNEDDEIEDGITFCLEHF